MPCISYNVLKKIRVVCGGYTTTLPVISFKLIIHVTDSDIINENKAINKILTKASAGIFRQILS